jgi:hypothetical protein
MGVQRSIADLQRDTTQCSRGGLEEHKCPEDDSVLL